MEGKVRCGGKGGRGGGKVEEKKGDRGKKEKGKFMWTSNYRERERERKKKTETEEVINEEKLE